VGNYVSNIFTKLQVADRAQAIIRALLTFGTPIALSIAVDGPRELDTKPAFEGSLARSSRASYEGDRRGSNPRPSLESQLAEPRFQVLPDVAD
jgi:hypothetical protein